MVCLFNSSDTVNQVYICSLLFFSLFISVINNILSIGNKDLIYPLLQSMYIIICFHLIYKIL